MTFAEEKAELLRQIEAGGFASDSTLRARIHLDALIAAQVTIEEPESIRAKVIEARGTRPA